MLNSNLNRANQSDQWLTIKVLRNYNKEHWFRWTASKRILCSEKLQRSLKPGWRFSKKKKTDQTIEQDCLRTINWFQYLWDNNQSGDEQEILSVLPVKVSDNKLCEGVQQFSWLRPVPNKSQSEKILCLSCRQRSRCTSTLKLWRRFGCFRWQMFWLHEDVYR